MAMINHNNIHNNIYSDLSTGTIKSLFEKQIKDLTMRTIANNNLLEAQSKIMNFQLSGGWII